MHKWGRTGRGGVGICGNEVTNKVVSGHEHKWWHMGMHDPGRTRRGVWACRNKQTRVWPDTDKWGEEQGNKWGECGQQMRARVGTHVHPLLPQSYTTPHPSWNAQPCQLTCVPLSWGCRESRGVQCRFHMTWCMPSPLVNFYVFYYLSWFYFFNALTPTHDLSHDIYALCHTTSFSYMFHHYASSFTHDPLESLRLCYPPLCLYTYSSYLSSAARLQSVHSMPFATLPMPPPFSLIIIGQLNRCLYYHYYIHSLGCASLFSPHSPLLLVVTTRGSLSHISLADIIMIIILLFFILAGTCFILWRSWCGMYPYPLQYGVHRYGYGLWNLYLWYTCAEPYKPSPRRSSPHLHIASKRCCVHQINYYASLWWSVM